LNLGGELRRMFSMVSTEWPASSEARPFRVPGFSGLQSAPVK
jgi:hypothetical protein